MPLVLGTVALDDFEIPERINFGGSQRLVQHRLMGGRRVVDAMGHDDAPIRWDGRFRGRTAIVRARQIDLMRRAGKPLILTWDAFAYRVVIETFEADYEAFYEIPYRISCVVVADLLAEVAGAALQSLEDMVLGDLSGALGTAGDSPILNGAVTGLRSAVTSFATGGRLDFASLGGAAMSGLQAAAGGALATVAGQGASAGASLLSGPVAGVTAGGDPAAMASGVTGQVAAAEQASRAQGVGALLGRVRDNLGRAFS